MSTTPPDGPQDPQQPQDVPPGGTPPPPPPYGSAPPPPPSYGQSTGGGPDYGQPQQPPAQPYGQPEGQPYGQPAGQPAYGQGYGAPQDKPSKAMAITSLVLSFLVCIPFVAALVSIVLGVIVIRRSKDGRDHGRGLAVAGVIISVLVLLATIALLVVAVVAGLGSIKSVDELREGDCINAEGLKDDSATFGTITTVECTENHDAEVFAVVELSQAQVDEDNFSAVCDEATSGDATKMEVLSRDDIEGFYMTEDDPPAAGDQLACVIHDADGKDLTEPLG